MRNLLKVLLVVLMFTDLAQADEPKIDPVKVGDKFQEYKLEDAHHKEHSLKPDTKLVLISFEMDLSKSIHKWLAKKEPNFLEKNKAEYVADITEMPGIITWLFARPKMQKYPFTILLADDENFAPRFPKEEEKILAVELDNSRVIKNISFFKNMKEVDAAYFKSATEPTK